MTIEQLQTASNPRDLFIYLTSELYDARQTRNSARAAAILSAFNADARRALCIGTAALMAIGDKQYSDAIKSALSKELYDYFRQGGHKHDRQ